MDAFWCFANTRLDLYRNGECQGPVMTWFLEAALSRRELGYSSDSGWRQSRPLAALASLRGSEGECAKWK